MPEKMDMPMNMMPMWFYGSTEFTLLFKDFKSTPTTTGKYVLYIFIIFTFGILLEAINYHRTLMIKNLQFKEASIADRCRISLSYFVSVAIAYALMLCVMSFNAGVFFTVVFSLTLGNSFFSFMQKKSITLRSLASENAYKMVSGEDGDEVNCCPADDGRCEPGGATNLEEMVTPDKSPDINLSAGKGGRYPQLG